MFNILLEGLEFPEAPFWSDRDECLYFVEWHGNRVTALRGEQPHELFKIPGIGGPSGLIQDTDGNFWLCLYDACHLARFSPQGELLTVIDSYQGMPFLGVCDLSLGLDGSIYFSDSGNFEENWLSGRPVGALYCLYPGGELNRIDDGICFPNGVALSLDGKSLYVNEHRANRILVYDVLPDGSVAHRRIFYNLDESCLLEPDICYELGPDGMCLGQGGTLWVAHYGAGKLVHISPNGQYLGEIHLPRGRKPTNAVFHHEENSLYVTEAEFGILYRIDLSAS